MRRNAPPQYVIRTDRDCRKAESNPQRQKSKGFPLLFCLPPFAFFVVMPPFSVRIFNADVPTMVKPYLSRFSMLPCLTGVLMSLAHLLFFIPSTYPLFFSFTMLFYSQMRMREEELTPSEKPKKSCKFVLTSQLSRFILGGRCNEDNGFSHPPTIHSIFYVKLWIVREVISDTRRIVRLRYPYSLRLLPTARLLGLNPNALGSALISVSYQLSSAPPSAQLG